MVEQHSLSISDSYFAFDIINVESSLPRQGVNMQPNEGTKSCYTVESMERWTLTTAAWIIIPGLSPTQVAAI
jgi:hypothetical protein